MQLGARLAAIATLVPSGALLADIGTDHAYLPVHLVGSGQVSRAIATDVHPGPYRSALAMVSAACLTDQIAVRFGDGLAVLRPGEVDTLVIAGMGGNTIVNILEAHRQVTASLKRLVLQPMVGARTVRHWLFTNGWNIVDEVLASEESILYEVIAAEPGRSICPELILYDIGPVLWEKRPALLKEHIERLLVQARRVLTAMEISPVAKDSAKYQEYVRKIYQLEEKNACL